MNYFELFDLPITFIIDKNELSKKYIALQKKYHPDFYTKENEMEQEEALNYSSQINKGLKVLRNPDETIRYVLQLKGVLEEDEKYALSPDFLMKMMELNEDFGDGTEAKIELIQSELYSEIAPIIEQFDSTSTSEADLLKVKDYYFKKKYLQRILDRIDD
jgi:molecular chaperone HscB